MSNARMIKTLLKNFGLIFFYSILLLAIPFIALGLGIITFNASIRALVQRFRWIRGLRRNGRMIAASELLSIAKEGTLIVDRPDLKFKSSHCWWTTENVPEISPVAIPTDEQRLESLRRANGEFVSEFDEWCWQRYLEPENGTAILVGPAHHGDAMAAKLREQLPTLLVVYSWSAAAIFLASSQPPNSRLPRGQQR